MVQEPVDIEVQQIVSHSLSSTILGCRVDKIASTVQNRVDLTLKEHEPERKEVADTLQRGNIKLQAFNGERSHIDTSGSLVSKIEIAVLRAVIRTRAMNELQNLEHSTQKKLEEETESWRTGRQTSIDARKQEHAELKQKFTEEINRLQQEEQELKAQFQSQVDTDVAKTEDSYNHLQTIQALQKAVIDAKKSAETGVSKLTRLFQDPQSTLIEINDIKAVNIALRTDPNLLKTALIHQLVDVSGLSATAGVLVDKVYSIAGDPKLVDYVRNNIGTILDPDFDAELILKGSDWQGSSYQKLQKELITLGIAAVILRKNINLPDEMIPIVEALRKKVHDSTIETVRNKRSAETESTYALKKKEVTHGRAAAQRSLEDTLKAERSNLKDEIMLNDQVPKQIKAGMELLYAQLYPEGEKYLHNPGKSYLALYAERLTDAFIRNEQTARIGESTLEGINQRVQTLREQISEILLPGADKETKDVLIDLLRRPGTDTRTMREDDWTAHQFEIVNRIISGDRAEICNGNDIPGLVATIERLMNGSPTKELDIILAENPKENRTWVSKRTKRPIRVNATDGEFAVISIPYNEGAEYFHFFLSRSEKRLLKIEISSTENGARELYSNPNITNERLFWAFLNDTSGSDEVGASSRHKMLLLTKEKR